MLLCLQPTWSCSWLCLCYLYNFQQLWDQNYFYWYSQTYLYVWQKWVKLYLRNLICKIFEIVFGSLLSSQFIWFLVGYNRLHFCLVDGGPTDWSQWAACSSGCARKRTRDCTQPSPSFGGSTCSVELTQETSLGKFNYFTTGDQRISINMLQAYS